ncbi:MAG TPA: DUF4351 domain-containing protein [Armatimonadota bacterium]|nr:DUF4351 domain-containing protein [Armatimonadota bacterium]
MTQGFAILADFFPDELVQARAEQARSMVLRVLHKRFGVLPVPLVARVEAADAEWCMNLLDRALDVESLVELDLA